MLVGVNTLSVSPGAGGVETYLKSMLSAMLTLDHKNEYALIVSPQNEGIFDFARGKARFIPVGKAFASGYMRILADQILVPLIVRRHGIDVLVSPGTVGTLFPGCRQIVVVQAHLALKSVRKLCGSGNLPLARRLYYDAMFAPSLRRSDIVIGISSDMANRIKMEACVPDSSIRIILEGVSSPAVIAAEPVIEGPYILFLSTLYPYKNALRLLESFLVLKRERLIRHKLVFAGGDCCGEAGRLMAYAHSSGADGSIVLTGRVSDGAIWNLYRNADVFVFPSMVEGFGLPVLEAMACGTPVVASNRMSIPEVAGDAAIVIDPENTRAMADAIYAMISERALREDYIRRGYLRAAEFTWQKAAGGMLDVIEELGCKRAKA